MDWKIFYEDGSTFSSEDGSPTDAPALGIQVIVQNDPDSGRYNQSGSDYYVYRDGRWWGVDIFGLFDFLIHHSPVKFGRTTDNETYLSLFHRAEDDPDFLPRSGFHKRLERRR
jgi:hypothetical protein